MWFISTSKQKISDIMWLLQPYQRTFEKKNQSVLELDQIKAIYKIKMFFLSQRFRFQRKLMFLSGLNFEAEAISHLLKILPTRSSKYKVA